MGREVDGLLLPYLKDVYLKMQVADCHVVSKQVSLVILQTHQREYHIERVLRLSHEASLARTTAECHHRTKLNDHAARCQVPRPGMAHFQTTCDGYHIPRRICQSLVRPRPSGCQKLWQRLYVCGCRLFLEPPSPRRLPGHPSASVLHAEVYARSLELARTEQETPLLSVFKADLGYANLVSILQHINQQGCRLQR